MGETLEPNRFTGVPDETLDLWWEEADNKGLSHGSTAGQISEELSRRRQPKKILSSVPPTQTAVNKAKTLSHPIDGSSGMREANRLAYRRRK